MAKHSSADAEGLRYLAIVAAALAEEIDGDVASAALRLASDCSFASAAWDSLWRGYETLAREVAHRWNDRTSVAHEYLNMEEFWADADRQALGRSNFTFWDTYEHGRRRRLEKTFATAYGAPSALLVNSGMSAIAAVIGSMNLSRGDVIVTGEQAYFETTELLDRFVVSCGVEVRRVAFDDPAAVVETLEDCHPRLLLAETATNAPKPIVPHSFSRWRAASPETCIVIDNSVQSHATRWFDPESPAIPDLVVESAVKYLTHEAMAGVVYGAREKIERVRDFARSTGQQLQERAFNWIRPGEITAAALRLRLHSRNVELFYHELLSGGGWEFIRTTAANAGHDIDATSLFRNGTGCLVFLALPGPSEEIAQLHRRVMAEWKRLAIAKRLVLSIRAGFGWTHTSARAYESSRLNQADAPSYLRVSIGIEPEETVRQLARLLIVAAREATKSYLPEVAHG